MLSGCDMTRLLYSGRLAAKEWQAGCLIGLCGGAGVVGMEGDNYGLASTIFELPFLNFECQQMRHRMQSLVLVICL